MRQTVPKLTRRVRCYFSAMSTWPLEERLIQPGESEAVSFTLKLASWVPGLLLADCMLGDDSVRHLSMQCTHCYHRTRIFTTSGNCGALSGIYKARRLSFCSEVCDDKLGRRYCWHAACVLTVSERCNLRAGCALTRGQSSVYCRLDRCGTRQHSYQRSSGQIDVYGY